MNPPVVSDRCTYTLHIVYFNEKNTLVFVLTCLHYSRGDFRGKSRELPTAQLKINLPRSALCHQSNKRREIPVKSSCSYFMKIKGTLEGYEQYITVSDIF